MRTVASLAERLDMSAEEALEKLRYMLFDVADINAELNDEQSDLLIDVDDDPSVADRVRQTKLDDAEKARKRNERLKEAGQKAAAKRKAAAEAKKKSAAAPKKKAAGKKGAAQPASEEEAVGVVEHAPYAEILPAEAYADEAALTVSTEETSEILPAAASAPEEEIAAKGKAPKPALPKKKEKPQAPSVVIGAVREAEGPPIEFVRADGTKLDLPEIATTETPLESMEAEIEEEEKSGLLAEAERRQEEEELRKAKLATRSLVKPDPAVVEEVKRKAAERALKLQTLRLRERQTGQGAAKFQGEGAAPRKNATLSPGKTARKRQKKAEKMRAEEAMRRAAAATVREFSAAGPAGMRRRRRRHARDDDSMGAEMEEAQEMAVLEVEDGMTVEALANAMGVPVNDVILALMDRDILASKNQTLGLDLIRALAEEHGFEVHAVIPEEADLMAEEPDDPADLVWRAPVITVMGHVDHGKTTLLDRVRTANVAAGEAGGITQHIAAYDVAIEDKRVVFLDTPGHEAFTQMRARGAKITDIVVLVVAADDGVMPQTVEAIDHARAAEVPIVVAINKIDKPDAQPDRIRQELTRYELVDEKWGGKTVIKELSAKQNIGIDELIELLGLEAELLELKGNPKKRARGAIIESEISRGQGPVAWVLVQNGTLRVGDAFLAGEAYGRVRAMYNAKGEAITEAGPSSPVVVTGFHVPPNAGDVFIVAQDERVARAVAEKRAILTRQRHGQGAKHITLEDFHERMLAGEKPELRIVIKADVQGSVDVLDSSLAKVGTGDARITIVHSGVGGINESDVLLASASDAVIIGFHVAASPRAQKLAEQEGVDIRTYRVIYEAIDEVRKALEGMLAPDIKEVTTGHAEIRAVFRSSAFGNIAGCFVQDGEIVRGGLVRLVRDGNVVHTGKIGTLRREKDDARSVTSGFECGIKIDNFDDIKTGDVIEAYRLEQVAKTLSS